MSALPKRRERGKNIAVYNTDSVYVNINVNGTGCVHGKARQGKANSNLVNTYFVPLLQQIPFIFLFRYPII